MSKMVIKIICSALVIAGFFTSCQKEISTEVLAADTTGTIITGNTGNPNGLLVKIDVRGGVNATDSSITYYGYDAAKRVISQKLVGSPTGGISPNNSFTFLRDVNGIITQAVQKNASLSAQGVDSVITKVVYDATANHYKYSVSNLSVFGLTSSDSAVFVYDATGKFIQTIHYQASFASPSYAPSLRFDYAYTGNQFTTMTSYSYTATTASFTKAANYAYTYDTNVNPIQYGKDAPVILFSPESVNNSTQIAVTSPITTAGNFSITTSMTYNSANKPATAVIKNSSANTTQTATFYYQ